MKSLRELHTYQRQNRCSVVTSLRAFESKFLPTRLDGLHGFLVPLRPSFHLAPQFAPVFFCSRSKYCRAVAACHKDCVLVIVRI